MAGMRWGRTLLFPGAALGAGAGREEDDADDHHEHPGAKSAEPEEHPTDDEGGGPDQGVGGGERTNFHAGGAALSAEVGECGAPLPRTLCASLAHVGG